MSEYNHYEQQLALEQQVALYLAKVMGWMCVGLFTTVAFGMLFAAGFHSGGFMYTLMANPVVFYGAMILQIVIALAMSGAVNRITSSVATVLFMVYAALTGFTFSFLALVFELSSLLFTFGLTAFIFLCMSLYGYVTKNDLTRVGTLAFFGLLGIILGGIVNLFLRNTMLDFFITSIGIVIFVALIAYDTQKIKAMYMGASYAGYSEDSEPVRKMAIYGALTLYLDFINLFLKLLRLFGRRKD